MTSIVREGGCVELREAERAADAGRVDAVLGRQHGRDEHDGRDDERETTLSAMRLPDGACQPGDGSDDTSDSPQWTLFLRKSTLQQFEKIRRGYSNPSALIALPAGCVSCHVGSL